MMVSKMQNHCSRKGFFAINVQAAVDKKKHVLFQKNYVSWCRAKHSKIWDYTNGRYKIGKQCRKRDIFSKATQHTAKVISSNTI